MGDDFRKWLTGELTRLGWSHSELARRAGLSQVAVSNVISGNRNPGADFSVKIASALGESPEKVLRLAGILPTSPTPDDSPTLQEIMDLVRSLPAEDQKEILDFVRWRHQRRK